MSDYFERVERQIVRRVQDGVAPRRSWRRPAARHVDLTAAVLVVFVVAGVFLLAHGSGGGSRAPAPAAHGGLSVVLSPLPAQPPTAMLDRAVRILRERLHAAVPGASVSTADGQIVVSVANAAPGARSEIVALAAPGRLAFYDWEADAITPNGKTVASQLQAQNPTALEISQGNGASAPGEPGSGSLSRAQADALAAKLPGSVVLRAADLGAANGPREPQFFVLRGAPVMSNNAIVDPRAARDRNTGAADIEFGFTAAGRRAFEAVTAAVSRRGSLVSGLGETFNQHFAIALDNRLLTVPFIDYKVYPDGINGDNGADIAGSFTARRARTIATLLRYGPLPVNLTATG